MAILIPKRTFFANDASTGNLIIKHTQELPDSYLDALRAARDASTTQPMGENHRYASIPEVVADRWTAEGFDFKRAKPAEVMARLRKEGLDCLITTNRVL